MSLLLHSSGQSRSWDQLRFRESGKQTPPLGKSYSHIAKGTDIGRGGKLRPTQSSYISLLLREAGKVFSDAHACDLSGLDPSKVGRSGVLRGRAEALLIEA